MDGTVTFIGVGTCTIDASDPENSEFYASAGSLVITVIKKSQALSLTATLVELNIGGKSTLSTSGSSGSGAISYRITSGQNFCSITGAELTGMKSGKCKIRADIAADSEYSSASSNEISVNVVDSVVVAPSKSPTPTPTPTATKSSGPINPVPTPSPAPSPTPLPSAPEKPKATLPTPATPALSVPQTLEKSNPGPSAIDTGTTSQAESLAAAAASLEGGAGQRTLAQLARETLKGFSPKSGIVVEVIGAKTTGQFIVTPGVVPDPIAVSAALNESSVRTSTNFANINGIVPTNRPADDKIIGGSITSDANFLFASSKLGNPITVADLAIKSDSKWIKVNATVSTYKPGSIVYLAVTTQPVIFGAAIVNSKGNAEFSGYLPVDALPGGGHSIRIVGMRYLDGVSTDVNGKITLDDSTLTEIERFDAGTNATVKVSGATSTDGNKVIVRQIPLSKYKPWWTVWLVIWTACLVAIARRNRKIVFKSEKLFVSGIMFGAALPALVLGWTSATYLIMGIGALVGLAGAISSWLIPMKRDSA